MWSMVFKKPSLNAVTCDIDTSFDCDKYFHGIIILLLEKKKYKLSLIGFQVPRRTLQYSVNFSVKIFYKNENTYTQPF